MIASASSHSLCLKERDADFPAEWSWKRCRARGRFGIFGDLRTGPVVLSTDIRVFVGIFRLVRIREASGQ